MGDFWEGGGGSLISASPLSSTAASPPPSTGREKLRSGMKAELNDDEEAEEKLAWVGVVGESKSRWVEREEERGGWSWSEEE